jgi:hypothetical protein
MKDVMRLAEPLIRTPRRHTRAQMGHQAAADDPVQDRPGYGFVVPPALPRPPANFMCGSTRPRLMFNPVAQRNKPPGCASKLRNRPHGGYR